MAEPVGFAARTRSIRPFYVMEVIARVHELEAAGRDIVHMEVGEPDFPTAGPIVAAGQRALAEGRTRYTPALGIPELREAISGHYRDYYGVEVPAERIAVTPGASGALQLALGVTLDPGDRLLTADPGYPCNRNIVRMFDAVPVDVPVGPDSGYQLTAALIEQHWNAATRAVLVATPSNPTGTVLDADALAAIHAVTSARGGRLLVDEIYHGLVYDGEERTAAALADDLFVINSFSKYFGMTGWRLGWMVAPPDAIREVEKLAQNIFLSPSAPAQYAALAAFTPEVDEILKARRAEFARRRDFLLPALRELGFRIPVTPQGAFYLYADCSGVADDGQLLAHRLLEEAGVAVAPGIDFGDHRSRQHLRFAYTTSIERLQEGVDRIARLLRAGG